MPKGRKSHLADDCNTPRESPYSRRPRRNVATTNQTEVSQSIIDALREAEDENGHLICEHFFKLPSKRGNSDYYNTVVDPIDLYKISQRIKMEEYKSLDILTADIQLMVSNATKYYPENTQQYKDATVLLDTFYEIKNKLTDESSEDGGSASKPRKPQSTPAAAASSSLNADIYEVMKDVYENVVTETDDEGRVIAELFMKLPDREDNPDYYEVIKEPIDLDTIFDRIESKEYKTYTDLKKDVRLLAKNATSFNKPNSRVFADAGALKRLFEEKIAEVERGGKKSSEVCGVKTSARIKQRKSIADKNKAEEEVHQASIGVHAADNYQAQLYNEVVAVRNDQGLAICDPFMRLPNRRFYPTYYEEIANPITIKTIRRNIITEKYESIEDLNKDFMLLFDNALSYNLPSAQVYKDAAKLKKFVISKLPDYIAKEESGGKKVAGSSSSVAVSSPAMSSNSSVADASMLVRHSSPISTSVAANSTISELLSSSCTHWDADESSKKKRRKKKSKLLQTHLRAVYDCVMEAHDEEGREMITLFLEKPSRKDYPDYYTLILEPIDMRTIDRKIRTDKYQSVEDMSEDFQLMFNNARHYNEPGSEVYADANRLEKVYRAKLHELGPLKDADGMLDDSFATDDKERLLNREQTTEHKLEKFFTRVRDHVDVTNRNLCEIFNHLPTKQELPDYYKVIKKPMDMERIQIKMQGGNYTKVAEMLTDMLLCFDNACVYNEPGSLIYKDALMLQAVAIEAAQEIDPVVEVDDVRELVQRIMSTIFVAVVSHQDENGRLYSESLFQFDATGDKQQASASGEEGDDDDDGTPRSLNDVMRNLQNRRYRRLDVFQEHVFSLFEDVRAKNRTDCEVYEDVVAMQKVFVIKREELCGNAAVFVSPANDYRMCALQEELDAERRSKVPREQAEDAEMDKAGDELLEKMQSKEATESFKFQGVELQVGDYVYVNDGKADVPHVVLIKKLYNENRDSGQVERMMYGCWFFRPKATFHLPNKKFYLKEVFLTDYFNTVPVSSICGRCHVMSSRDYFRMRPASASFDDGRDVFVCESRYSTRNRQFKRLKQAHLPLTTKPVPLVQRAQPLERIRVSSCFSEQNKPDEKRSDTPGGIRAKLMNALLHVRDDKWPKQVIDIARENTQSDTQNPNCEATYYTQYLYKDMWVKLGDCVYVQDTRCPKTRIARIERLWTDKNMNIWFHGSWFVECNDTKHEPCRTFYDKEVCISSAEETIKMTQAIGKCMVLPLREYQSCRPTEIPEKDVYLFESRYFITDETIKKVARPKRPQPSSKVIADEYYYFRRPLELKVTASKLLKSMVAKENQVRENEVKMSMEQMKTEKAMQQQKYPGMAQGGVVMTQQPYPNATGGMMAHHTQQGSYPTHYNAQYANSPLPPLPDSQQNRSSMAGSPPPNYPQQQQGRGLPSFAHHPLTPTTPGNPPTAPSHFSTPVYNKVVDGKQVTPANNSNAPGSLSSSSKRKQRPGHATGYILFAATCHPKVRAQLPQLSFGEISKKVGEEWRNLDDQTKKSYEQLAKDQAAKAEAEGRVPSSKRSKKKKRDPFDDGSVGSPSTPQPMQQQQYQPGTPSRSQTPNNYQQQQGHMYPPGTPQQHMNQQQQQPVPPYPGTPAQQQPAPVYQAPPPPPQITVQQQAATVNGLHVRKRGPLFVKPPPKFQRVNMHTDAYCKYIEKMAKGDVQSLSPWRNTFKVKEGNIHLSREQEMRLPGEWLGNGRGRHPTVKTALWELRDLMLKDAMNMRNELNFSSPDSY